MKIHGAYLFTGMIVLAAVVPALAASGPDPAGVQTQMVITVQPNHKGGSVPQHLQANDLTVTQGKTRVPVVRLERMAGDLAGMQLFVFLDDATRSSSLGLQLPALKSFLKSLPASTQVAAGYMRNGTFALVQPFTTDHQAAAESLRLPAAIPGENGSPYFALSDLVKHWPSTEPTGRRAVMVLTDGVDRYYSASQVDDPYVDTAIEDSLKNNVTVYSIYLRGAGLYGRNIWLTNLAQSRLGQVSQETGGYAYFQDLDDPVTITPFLDDFSERLQHQYQVTIAALRRVEESGAPGFLERAFSGFAAPQLTEAAHG